MDRDKITRLYLIIILITGIGLRSHVTVLPQLYETAGRDGWLSVLFAFLLHTVWLVLIWYVLKKMDGTSLNVWLEERAGKAVSVIIRFSAAAVLVLLSATTLIEVGQWTRITYLPLTPELVIIGALALLCLFTSLSSLRTIAILAGVLLPFIVLLGLFVAAANIPNKDYSLILPVLEHGYPRVFLGMIYPASAFSELVVILFINHRIKNPLKYWQLVLLTLVLAMLTIGPYTAGIAEFGTDEAARLRFPAYEQWALITLGRFIESVDFLAIYQWISGTFIRVSFLMYLITQMIPIKNQKAKIVMMTSLYIIILILSELPENDMQYLDFMRGLFFPGVVIYFALITIVLVIISFIPKQQKGGKAHETA
ncbi:GerAB/ArcD/ProY family transporter [Salipaludibacillus aurantiacus]|uniref:Spore germination protein (Amino acid permease) n=1 Tax=Salipaludibacillus aurantiacus TaxID=1601833 RepID=A0A1H9VQB2_9BACI|nr:endospore germination permease [Salipaludibacillus aurantiacus]SES23990.1 spore germination protein (amino acid permease) [Salipaludibacillus aurantiacus]